MKNFKLHAVLGPAIALSLSLILPAQANPLEKAQEVIRAEDLKTAEASPDNFTGRVLVTNLFAAEDPMRSYAALVTFDKGAHTAWHEHTLGQKLIVTEGLGLTGYKDGTVHYLRPGDIVICPPGVSHWHGASLTMPMSHIAIGESDGLPSATWHEKIGADEYRALAGEAQN